MISRFDNMVEHQNGRKVCLVQEFNFKCSQEVQYVLKDQYLSGTHKDSISTNSVGFKK